MPIASATTAKIGTPSTNAANIRWISAAIHTAARLPMSGKSRYALALSATAWTNNMPSAISLLHEEWLALGEIDRHGASDLAQQLWRDLAQPALARPVFHAFGDDAAHERRNTSEARLRLPRPGECGYEVAAVAHTGRFDHLGPPPVRLIRARGIRGEHVSLDRERARATAAAELPVLTLPALAAE